VEFLHLWGPELTSRGPDGSLWRLNREIGGTLPQIIDEVESLLLERVGKRGFVDSFRRRDEPEYPGFALREAIINAIAHRDYTLRGSRVQVRLYPDRIEVDTPGGLPPPVTVDNIEDEKATRNEAIVVPLQDMNYMERRGYGFNAMVATMREAGLAPPLVKDNGASFGLCLRSHVLMSPETVAWLRQFDGFDLSPQERLALAYLRTNEGFITRLYNRDFVRLTGCTSVEATQALRRLVERHLLAMHNTRGGAYYSLPETTPEPPANLFTTIESDEEKVLALAAETGSVGRRDVMQLLNCDERSASNLLLRLKRQKRLFPEGERRWTRYTLGSTEAES
jgi:ATP-dependent DNA helicase RecG